MKSETNFVRIEKSENFSVVNNTCLRDERLSWKAKGILVYLLHLPNDWVVNLNEVSKHSKDGYDSFKSGINELKKFGYVERKQSREEGTGFIKWETIIREIPLCEKPQAENPLVENPLVENPHLLNTNKLNTNKLSNKDIVQNEAFETFWSIYPKRVSKAQAEKSFNKALRKHNLEVIVKGVKLYNDYLKAKGTERQYIKNPSTFLNAESYLDEYEEQFNYPKQITQEKVWEADIYGSQTDWNNNGSDIHELPKPIKQIGF